MKRVDLGPPANLVATVLEVGSDRFVIFEWTPTHRIDGLTKAELDVLERVIAGKTTAEIAEVRGTSHHTVANQLGAIFRKANVRSRAELIARASRRG